MIQMTAEHAKNSVSAFSSGEHVELVSCLKIDVRTSSFLPGNEDANHPDAPVVTE